MKSVVYIVGPTASGKTALSISLAKHFCGEIISGDSMQIYKGMHIASAAPDENEKSGVNHHLFEFLEPQRNFSVAEYVNMAGDVIDKLHSNDILPFVVGGTGLYISSLAFNIDFGSDSDNSNLRESLEKRYLEEGAQAMYDYLCSVDPLSAKKIALNDKKRILRAIEVFETSGVTKSQRDLLSKQQGEKYNNIFIGVTYKDRELLYERINKRVDIMLQNGLLEEARLSYGNFSGTAAQAIGHKELYKYFDGQATLEEAVEHLKMQTRRYAKRQMTWFRKNENINWIYMDEDENPILTAENIVNKYL